MGMGNAFAALTQGWFGGVNQRHAWEDRQRAQERQEKLDTYYDEEFGWRREENERNKTRFGWETAEQADRDRARDQVFADDQARRADGRAAIAAADSAFDSGGLGLRPESVSTKSVSASPQVTSNRTLSAGERAKTPTGLLLPPLDPSGREFSITPGTVDGQASATPVARAAKDAPEASKAKPQAEDKARSNAGDADRYGMLAGDPDHVYGQSGGLGPDLKEGGKAIGRTYHDMADAAWGGLKDTAGLIGNSLRKPGEFINGKVNSVLDYALGTGDLIPNEPVGETVQDRALSATGKAGNAILDTFTGDKTETPATKSAVPAADPKKPRTQEAASTAVSALEQTPSGEAVTQVAQSLGVNPSVKHPQEKRSQIVTTWMDQFQKEGMPIIVRGMVERGDYDGAQKMQEWMESSQAQSGLRHWANAGLAASIGDFDTFFDSYAEAFNTKGYFDNGYQMVREKSDFMRTENGDIAGAVVTFRDEETGREFQQEFSGMDDIVAFGIQMLSPEEVLKHQMDMQKTQAETLKAQAELARSESKDLEKRIDGIAKTIFDSANKNALPGEPGISYSEARAQAEEQLGLGGQAGGGGAIYARVPD